MHAMAIAKNASLMLPIPNSEHFAIILGAKYSHARSELAE